MTVMKKNIFLLVVTLLLTGLAGCSDEDTKSVVPSDVIDLSADTQDKPGYIVLRWVTPDDNTIRYIKVSYYDYLLEQDVVRLASVYADSVLIPDTRKSSENMNLRYSLIVKREMREMSRQSRLFRNQLRCKSFLESPDNWH